MHIAQYIKAQDLESAWELNQKKGSVIIGGGCWLRLSRQRMYRQVIDIAGLGLDTIEETDAAIRIGAMTTLRQVELSPVLAQYTQGAFREAVRHIVGTQFRNMATMGGSVCGRFGFSDILTLLMALQAEVELYKKGRVSMAEFADEGAGQDIVTHIIIPKMTRRTAYASLRRIFRLLPVLCLVQTRWYIRLLVRGRCGRKYKPWRETMCWQRVCKKRPVICHKVYLMERIRAAPQRIDRIWRLYYAEDY